VKRADDVSGLNTNSADGRGFRVEEELPDEQEEEDKRRREERRREKKKISRLIGLIAK
jgi:hypothetical protein